MRLLSQGSQYAISALIALAKQPDGKPVSAADLAGPLKCPPAYLSRLLARLKPANIIRSHRGLNGGVSLARPPEEISLIEVIHAIDGKEFFTQCFLGIEGCGQIEPCPFHEFWSVERKKIEAWLTEMTFARIEEAMSDAWFDLRLKYS